MTGRWWVFVAALGVVLGGCAGDAQEDGRDDGGDGVAQAPAADGEPGAASHDETVTLAAAVASSVDDGDGHHVVMEVHNEGTTSRRVVLPVGTPRVETVDGGTRISWLRTVVTGSDPETGEVTFDRSVPSVDAVSIAAGETWEPADLRIESPDTDLEGVTELCLEVMPIPVTGTPASSEPTGEVGPVRSGWEDGEPILLACGPVRVEGPT